MCTYVVRMRKVIKTKCIKSYYRKKCIDAFHHDCRRQRYRILWTFSLLRRCRRFFFGKLSTIILYLFVISESHCAVMVRKAHEMYYTHAKGEKKIESKERHCLVCKPSKFIASQVNAACIVYVYEGIPYKTTQTHILPIVGWK